MSDSDNATDPEIDALLTCALNVTGDGADYRKSALTIVRGVVFALYLVTFVFGFAANTLTILVILSDRKLKSVAACFMLNLAIADDLFIISLPFMAHR